jgi:ubiquinone/menaquinone biosynthesis C-methylase UbiE
MSEGARADRAVQGTRRHFDTWAGRYEEDPVSRWLAGLQSEALAALDLGPRDRLLDVGCGSGAAVRSAAQIVERAVGVDVSPGMIERARALAGDAPNVEFDEAEASHLPFEDGSFTTILCTTSFHHHPDPLGSMKEMARVLGSSGRLVIGDWTTDRLAARAFDAVLRRTDPSHVGMKRGDDLASLAYGAGLTRLQARRLVGGAYAIVRATKP